MIVFLFGLQINVLAQIFGFFGLVIMCLSFFQKNKKGYAGVMVIAHIFFALEAFVLKGYSNVVTNLVGVLRNGTLFCFLLKKDKDPPKWCIWLFAVLAVSGAAFFIDSVWAVIPVVCFLLQCVYLMSKSFMFLKFGSLITEGSMCAYNIFMGAYIGGIRQVIACTLLIISIVKYKKSLLSEADAHGTGTC